MCLSLETLRRDLETLTSGVRVPPLKKIRRQLSYATDGGGWEARVRISS